MALTKKVTLTVVGHTVKLSSDIKFYQHDQLNLAFEINEYGIDVEKNDGVSKKIMPINILNAILFIETPLGVDSIEPAYVENNCVMYHLTKEYTQHIGISKMQIQLTDDDGCCQVTLPEFTFEIKKPIYDVETILRRILLADEEGNLIVDEQGVTFQIGTQVYAMSSDEVAEIDGFTTKQIQDYNLDDEVSGEEDILVQDKGIVKRIKASDLINDSVDLSDYYTKEEIDTIFTELPTTVITNNGRLKTKYTEMLNLVNKRLVKIETILSQIRTKISKIELDENQNKKSEFETQLSSSRKTYNSLKTRVTDTITLINTNGDLVTIKTTAQEVRKDTKTFLYTLLDFLVSVMRVVDSEIILNVNNENSGGNNDNNNDNENDNETTISNDTLLTESGIILLTEDGRPILADGIVASEILADAILTELGKAILTEDGKQILKG